MINLSLSAHGIIVGIEVASKVITQEFEYLAKKELEAESLDIDCLSTLLFHRKFVKCKLEFLLQNIADVMHAYMQFNERPVDIVQKCAIISANLEGMIEYNNKAMEQLASVVCQKMPSVAIH